MAEDAPSTREGNIYGSKFPYYPVSLVHVDALLAVGYSLCDILEEVLPVWG